MNVIMKEEKSEPRLNLLFNDDLAIVETSKKIIGKNFIWKINMERRGLKINKDKTVVMKSSK